MIDAHCHLVETFSSISNLSTLKTSRLFIMSSKKAEWPLVSQIANDTKFAAYFGIHPWFAHLYSLNDLEELKSWVQKTRGAAVGEIGLDAVATNSQGEKYDFHHQFTLFSKQMEIAAELQVPVSIHSVKAFGTLLPYFKQLDLKTKLEPRCCPPTIMMHSFSGSIEVAKSLLKLPRIGQRFYFSFSSTVNSRSNKTLSRIQMIPNNRLLIESDVGDCSMVDEAMEKAALMVSEAKGWTREETIKITSDNAIGFSTF